MADDEAGIVGYVDPLVCSPGENVAVKISCHRPTFTSQVYRLGAGYAHPDAPPVSHRVVDAIPKQSHKGERQYSRIGSYAIINDWDLESLSSADVVSVSFWCWPTLLKGAGHEQYLFSTFDYEQDRGFELFLDKDGNLHLRLGKGIQNEDTTILLEPSELDGREWHHLELEIGLQNGSVHFSTSTVTQKHRISTNIDLKSNKPFIIASDSRIIGSSCIPQSSATFNGKIEGFLVRAQQSDTWTDLLALDFSLDIPSDNVRDSENRFHGRLVNAPSRAVTGHDWDASLNDWTQSNYGYAAIHFHDDDLDDAMWETTFEVKLPSDLRSGCYGVYVDDGLSTDFIPFFVRPDLQATDHPRVALIMPTFTYTAYANEHLHDETRAVHFPGDASKRDKYFRLMMRRPDLGVSLYDSHNDGSGTIFSSTKRPVLNMRPDYSMWLFDGPREFPTDLWFISFLDQELGEGGYDVITDHDISEYGADLLQRYNVLLSCSHPEYPTFNMLRSYERYLDSGGYFMYLGGNGYYWVTTHDPRRSHRIEVRRAHAGCRTFELPPGEHHHSLTGELGGLYRSRGQTPQKLFGVGSCAMGVGKGAAYGINDEAKNDPQIAPFFDKVDAPNNVIGDFGLVQGAASGDEIDRLDFDLGTPRNAVLLASTRLASGHSDDYMLFNEETLYPMVNLTGTKSDKVRSDIVYIDTKAGGAVFSVGSINWVGVMAWKNYRNNVAYLTRYVLHTFVQRSRGRRSEI